MNKIIKHEHLPVLRSAIRHYGEQRQIMKAVEEMAELTKELCKQDSKTAIADEMADVIIMLRQLLLIFHNENEVAKHVEFKVNRLNKRIKGE